MGRSRVAHPLPLGLPGGVVHSAETLVVLKEAHASPVRIILKTFPGDSNRQWVESLCGEPPTSSFLDLKVGWPWEVVVKGFSNLSLLLRTLGQRRGSQFLTPSGLEQD